MQRIKTYLTENKTIPTERLVFVNAGKQSRRTKVYGVRPDPREAAAKGCPTVSILGPAGIVSPGELSEYAAEIKLNGEPVTPTIKWSVSSGEIVSGQGTPRIQVREPNSSLTVTVELLGLPNGCIATSSESRSAPHPPTKAVKIGEMRNTAAPDLELFRRFRDELRDNPNNQGYIFIAYPPDLAKGAGRGA